jgi:thiol:disulfide interchange protein
METSNIKNIENEYINYINQNINNKKGVLLFFNASWCNPCKKVKTLLNSELDNIKNIVNISFIDIDTHKDNYNNNAFFYSFLKKKRIVRGIPSLLLYIKNEEEENIYPDFFCDTNTDHFKAMVAIIKKL